MRDGAETTKVKASEFRFKPAKGWLGGDVSEKVPPVTADIGACQFSTIPNVLDMLRSSVEDSMASRLTPGCRCPGDDVGVGGGVAHTAV